MNAKILLALGACALVILLLMAVRFTRRRYRAVVMGGLVYLCGWAAANGVAAPRLEKLVIAAAQNNQPAPVIAPSIPHDHTDSGMLNHSDAAHVDGPAFPPLPWPHDDHTDSPTPPPVHTDVPGPHSDTGRINYNYGYNHADYHSDQGYPSHQDHSDTYSDDFS